MKTLEIVQDSPLCLHMEQWFYQKRRKKKEGGTGGWAGFAKGKRATYKTVNEDKESKIPGGSSPRSLSPKDLRVDDKQKWSFIEGASEEGWLIQDIETPLQFRQPRQGVEHAQGQLCQSIEG